MKLTPELKTIIDHKTVYSLLYSVRFAPMGEPIMQDESGEYWLKRLSELRDKDQGAYVRASKDMGWER